MNEYWLLLLPVAAVSGWYTGRKSRLRDFARRLPSKLRRPYFTGLNYLINEQPDKAVDVFVKLLEVDSETVETHLALGNLFRRRGEVDRAIRIHQNLIARSQLAKIYRVQALLALGIDYLKAGMLDRAEHFFLELAEMGEESEQSLIYLLQIYQQEKDWRRAIEVASKLQHSFSKPMKKTIAQYYCELAERARASFDKEAVQKYLKRALSMDSQCVRANLIKARFAMEQEQYEAAIKAFKRIKKQDNRFLSETLSPLVECYQKMGNEGDMRFYLEECVKEFPKAPLIIALTKFLQLHQEEQINEEYIINQLKDYPSLQGLQYAIELYLKMTEGSPIKNHFTVLKDIVSQLIAGKAAYRCTRCGYSGKTLYWNCPSCHHWNTIKPIQSLEVV